MIQLKSSDYRLKDIDAKGTVIFIANSFGIEDVQGDVSLKGSFAKTLRESFSRLKYLYNHDRTKVIGVPVEAHENDVGLVIKAVLNLEKELGKDTYLDYKHALEYGRSVEHSVAVKAIKAQGTRPRYVSEWALGEVSYTPFRGANPETPLLAIKNEDGSNLTGQEQAFIEYCYNKGDYSSCRMKFMEALLEPVQPLDVAADEQIINFLTNIKF